MKINREKFIVLYIDDEKAIKYEYIEEKTVDKLIQEAERPLSHLAIHILRITPENLVYPLPARRYKPFTFSNKQRKKDEESRSMTGTGIPPVDENK